MNRRFSHKTQSGDFLRFFIDIRENKKNVAFVLSGFISERLIDLFRGPSSRYLADLKIWKFTWP